MTRISPGVARTALGLNLKHATFFLTHPGVVVDDEDHHGELQPEQEVEVAPALGHGAGLSRGQLFHLLPSSAGPSPSSSLNHPASPGAPTHYYLQYSEGIINQRLYPPSSSVVAVVSLLRGGLLATGQAWLMCWLVRTKQATKAP